MIRNTLSDLRMGSDGRQGFAVGLLLSAILDLSSLAAESRSAFVKVDFNRDIRPIFSDTCFSCHGPDDAKRKSGLRLDLKEAALKPAKSGKVAFVPGNSLASELYKRVASEDEDERMPPVKSGKKLTSVQVDLLRRWIDQGAEYKSHWAFITPTRPELPEVKETGWPRNEIDRFILARLEEEGLKPGKEADRTTLIRRLTLDLTGLPPTPAEVDAFLSDKTPKAYERVVDRLLASPHYGERMALEWLDAARYADTHGYHIDSARDMTHWRDWVIDSFNRNQPFDQFTIEQLAGDLLPNPTLDQKVASGFNRNHMINYEGGAIPEEYHNAYLIDRVNTTATVWLGLTMACAQCHDHKYDPFTMKDYYSFYAYFNSVAEQGLDGRNGNAAPMVQLPSSEQVEHRASIETKLSQLADRLKSAEAQLPSAQAVWESQLAVDLLSIHLAHDLLLYFPLTKNLDGLDQTNAPVRGTFPTERESKWVSSTLHHGLELDGTEDSFIVSDRAPSFERSDSFSYGAWVKRGENSTGAILARMDDTNSLRGFDLLLSDGKLHLHLIHAWPGNALRVVTQQAIAKDSWTHVFATYDGSSKASGVKLYVNGKEASLEVTHDTLSDSILTSAPLNLGKRSSSHPFKGALSDVRLYRRALSPAEVAGVADAPAATWVQIPKASRTEEQSKALEEHFRTLHAEAWSHSKDELAVAKRQGEELEKTIPTSMVMGELEKPRETFVLMRGQYDKKGDRVVPALPASLPAPSETLPGNRLGLARWLVSSEQPLTARVIVNRYWQMYFGNGIVKTAENFGSQADWPTHPELLDWLATEFVHSGWDVKGIQKLILMSAAYRQSSTATPEVLERDPENRWLSRGARLRLPAEFIRDQALAMSGLINSKIGGESVFPYQPAGLWEELMAREDNDNFTAQKYRQSKGTDLYRRSMYTFWKRTSPPSTLGTLDAPDRQTCVVRRQRTNTPLQALLLMNDPTFVESSRKLAERIMTEAHDDKSRVILAYRLAMARSPKAAEIEVLMKLYREQLADYRKDPAAAARLLGVGESELRAGLDPAQLAAWTLVTNTILNLDETITKS